MFAAMGEGGGNSVRLLYLLNRAFPNSGFLQLLAGLSIVLGIPFPVFIYFKGEMLRARNPLTADSVKRMTVVHKQPKVLQDEEKGPA
jgi:hypothetical protein